MGSRPDVAKSAPKLSEFVIDPSQRHLEAVDRAIPYLYGTLLGLIQTAKETYWWKRMLTELGLDLAKEHKVSTQYDWLRKEVQANYNIKIPWVPTSQIPAGNLTKPLTSQDHDKFVRMLNLQSIKGLISKKDEFDRFRGLGGCVDRTRSAVAECGSLLFVFVAEARIIG